MQKKISIITAFILFLTSIGIFVSSCKPDETAPSLEAKSIEIVSGEAQTAQIETALTNTIVIIVKDQNGIAFKGAKVTFAASDGSVSSATATTDADGKVSINWTLGSTIGTQTLTATAFKADGSTAISGSPILVTATGSKPPITTGIKLVSGENQSATVSTTLSNPIIVIIKDQNGNTIKGVTVKFAVSEGSVSSATATTGTDGKANVNWTLGSTIGTQTLTATAFKANGTTALSGSPISVTATGVEPLVATSIELVSGDSQSALASTVLSNPVIVIVKDQNDDAFEGAVVNFAVSEGSVSSTTATTGTDGKANVNWTLGSTIGTQTLTATAFKANGTTALSGSPISVTATGVEPLVATNIELVSGDNQSALASTVLSNPVIVIVKDQNDDAFEGAVVNFAVSEGSVSSTTATTGSDGKANINWTLGTTLGTQTLTVTAFKAGGTTALSDSPISVKTICRPPNITDTDGNSYKTVKIGNQIWMAENLINTEGGYVPTVAGNAAWGALADNNTAMGTYKTVYSNRIYTWAAAMGATTTNNKGICPTGWHIPSKVDFEELISFLGGYSKAGAKLKSAVTSTQAGTDYWLQSAHNGTNENGFNAFANGYRDNNNSAFGGFFTDAGYTTYFWTSTQAGGTQANSFFLKNNSKDIFLGKHAKSFGFSIRCVKD